MKARWKLNPDHIIEDIIFGKILKAAKPNKHRHLALKIAGNMGWRVGEIVHIRIEDMDLTHEKIKKGVLKKKVAVTPYVSKPISKVVLPDLKRYVGKRRKGWLFEGYGKVCDVFPNNPEKCPGGHVSKRSMQNWFDEACAKAKITKVKGRGIHSLRMCFGIRAATTLKDVWKVRDLLDHSDISVSSEYVLTVNQKEALDDVGGVE